MDLVALAAIAGGTDAVAVAKAARAADWRALGWKAEKLVLHAAQNPKVAADASALALVPWVPFGEVVATAD